MAVVLRASECQRSGTVISCNLQGYKQRARTIIIQRSKVMSIGATY
jgi:hypothetical protein